MVQLRKWKLDSIGYQDTFFERFGDRTWDLIKRTDTNTLNTKICYTLFGKPFSNCNPEEVKTVEDTRYKVLELSGSGDVHFNCTFICVLLKKSEEAYIFSLIRTKQTYEKDVFFIERQPGRVYRGFNDFLKNNKLPKCDMCFPKNGFYRAGDDGRVQIQFQESASCSVTLKVLDIVSFVGKAASLGLMTVSVFFPVVGSALVAGGVILGGTTTYSTSRNIIHLVDRNKHHETISPINKDARLIWLEMTNDIIGVVLAGGAAALPRLMASGRMTVRTMSAICEVLSWASLGVNSFGMVANIASLVVKFRNGTLSQNDMEYFLTSCLFISNLIVSQVVGNEIIRQLSERPSQLHSLFKMTTNTSFKAVKMTLMCFSTDTALQILCGKTTQTFFMFFDLQYTGSVVKGVADIVKKFQQKTSDPRQLCFELYKLLNNHLQQVQTEVNEAVKKLNKFCKYLANQQLTINGKHLFRNSQYLAPEVVHSIEEVVNKLFINENVIRENSACELMRLAVQLGRETGVENEQQFMNVCKILMGDVKSKCDRRLALKKLEKGSISTSDKQTILTVVLKELQTEFKKLASFPTGIQNAAMHSDELCLRHLYQVEDVDGFVFETSSALGEFDKFLNDTACHLLRVSSLPKSSYINLDDERTMVVTANEKSVVFFFDRNLEKVRLPRIFGIVLLITDRRWHIESNYSSH